jgi:hypothetical protein
MYAEPAVPKAPKWCHNGVLVVKAAGGQGFNSGLLTQLGGQGAAPGPLPSRVHRIPTSVPLNRHGV